ncbi:MAG TPA: recombination mediator RecR [Candidatus Babeliaceae bacterium]|nr:recombination mediator RecR [Candidatus Babeliaceae bacterium]
MIDKLPTLNKLLRQLQRVPYLASKNLYRVAHHFLEMDQGSVQEFCNILMDAVANITKCSDCCAWKESKQGCSFCDDPKRNRSVICVVESWHDLYAIERSGCYQGLYHVLGGALSPLDGIGPDNLAVTPLLKRVDSDCKEIVLAMNQTPEGEATSIFVARKLQPYNLLITCLARGMPVGSSLEFMDKSTLHKAIVERRNF